MAWAPISCIGVGLRQLEIRPFATLRVVGRADLAAEPEDDVVEQRLLDRCCHRRLPLHVANDGTAQVFVVAWRKIEDMPVGDAVLPWLYAVARFEVSSAQRRWRNLRAKLDGQAAGLEDGPEMVVVRNAEHEELLAALGSLRPADREVLRLRVYEELPLAHVAAVPGSSSETTVLGPGRHPNWSPLARR